jgi:outer membrane receptor protein involved in Fe transport
VFGSRPLVEDGSVKGRQTFTLNANVGYRTPRWEGVLECLNVLDRKDRDIEYFDSSQMRNETAAVDDIHFHPAEPRMFRARVTYKF